MEVLTLALSIIMLVSDSIDLFLADIAPTRAKLTMKTYRGRLNLLRQDLGDRELSTLVPLPEQTSVLGAWIDSQRKFPNGKNKAPDTIRLTIISVELWQAWLLKQKHIPALLVERQKKPGGRQRELLPEADETRALLEHVPDDFRIALRVLRLTGCRPGELCSMRIEDFDQRQMLIILTKHKTAKKTGRPRIIAVAHEALIDLVRDAIGDRTTGEIFLRASGKPWTVEALSAKYRAARKAAGLQSGLVLYLSRHEHATQLYEATQDIYAVASALGHKNILMASRYARATPAILKRNQSHFKEGL
jgi:integrase